MVLNVIKDHVVTLVTLGEILFGVVNDVICAELIATISTLPVLHTPVTSAPNDFAIWTAKVPTPPVAPLIRTFCPG